MKVYALFWFVMALLPSVAFAHPPSGQDYALGPQGSARANTNDTVWDGLSDGHNGYFWNMHRMVGGSSLQNVGPDPGLRRTNLVVVCIQPIT
jgi:hypothetical protein